MDQTPKKSSVAGIPYVVIVFVLVATIPSLVSDMFTRHKIDVVSQEVSVLKVQNTQVIPAAISLTPTPSATPSATVTPSRKQQVSYPTSFKAPLPTGR